MRHLFWISVLLLASPLSGYSFDDNYPPYDLKVFKDRILNAAPVNTPAEKGMFQDGDLSIAWVTKVPASSVVEIRYKTKLVVKVELPGKGDHSDFLGEAYYADVDGNGLNDIILHPAFYGSGLGSFLKTTTLLFQVSPGKFRQLQFQSFYFEARDFVDLVGDGKLELLVMQLAQIECSDKKIHSFWTYVPFRVKDFNLVRVDEGIRDYPKFIWFSHKPNSQPTDKLFQEQKDGFIQTLPSAIKSKPI